MSLQCPHDEAARKQYDARRRSAATTTTAVQTAPAAREVGLYGQLLSALMCLALGLLLLLLVHFNGLWFLWPLSFWPAGVILFGVMIAHSTMTNVRESMSAGHPVRRFRALRKLRFGSSSPGAGMHLFNPDYSLSQFEMSQSK